MLGKFLLLLNLLIIPLQSQSQSIPHINLGACPAQSNSLTSLYLTYTSDSNRVNFTVNGWYTDALPPVIRINQYYNMTPRIPKYIFFAHPPYNPRPVSKIEASYYTGKTANTCDNLDFTFSGRGWNVDRVNLLSTTSLFDVQVSVKQDYVIKYLLDSNAVLTYAFMTPNTICSLIDIHNTACWCPVLQVQMPTSWISGNPVPIPSPVPVPISSPEPIPISSPEPIPIPSPVPVPIPSTLCKLFTGRLQSIQAISNTCDACFYECNSNNNCNSYSWNESSLINWGNDTFCESLLNPPIPSPVPVIPSTLCKLYILSFQSIQAISNTCDTCWYECNSNNDCAFYSWNGSQIISWGVDTFCESLLISSPVPSPVPVPIPSPVPSPIPSPVPSPVPSPIPSPVPVPIPSPVPVPIPSPVPSPVPVPIPSPVPVPVPSGTIPRVDVGSCPGYDQSSSLTSLYITYQTNIATNRIIFTINGWNNDALPSSVRSNQLYSITPIIPKYIYFAHPPTNPTPSSKSIANYFTKTTSNTCDNFNFNFGGYGWNVDRVNLLSTTTLLNVEVSVNLDYVYNYLLDSNKMLTYAFMTPNSACGPSNPNNNHCWCPVLQVQIN